MHANAKGLSCHKHKTKVVKLLTIPNKNTMARAATMDNPAPDNDASVKSLGIFL
jgi:hypothetical protein